MLGLQFCIGAVNDVVDEPVDSRSKPHKPIPAGLASRPVAMTVAALAGGGGLLLAALIDPPDPLPLAMAALMLGAGLAYDLWLKPTQFAWACFALAFPVLPVFAWYGAAGEPPPRWELLLPVAALAGPALHLSNALVDLETDRAAGLRTLAVALGRRWTIAANALLMATVHLVAWLTLAPAAGAAVAGLASAAGALAAVGVVLGASVAARRRGWGWTAQALSIAILGISWLLAAAS